MHQPGHAFRPGDGKLSGFGKTFPVMTVLPDMTIGCLFERDGYRNISFSQFTLGWLTDGKDQLKAK